MIQVKQLYAHNDLRNFSYLITDTKTGNCWVIDPYDAAPFVHLIKKDSLSLQGILNTHQHFDHIRGNAELVNYFRAPILKVLEASTIELDESNRLRVIDSPGHTMDHQVFVWEKDTKDRALFAGDTLFNSGVGNCKNGGDPEILFETVQKLLTSLPDDVLLYPGHDYAEKNLRFALSVEPENARTREKLKETLETDAEHRKAVTLGEEKKYNPFFRLDSGEIKKTIEQAVNSERELFKTLRSRRDRW
jgi:hydroxyacylglutathione hydrolase